MSRTVSRIALALAAVFLIGATPAAAQFDPPNGQWGKGDSDDIRVMTWNVRDAIRSGANKTEGQNSWTACARIVALFKPDVLILQETGDNGSASNDDSVAVLLGVVDQFLYGGGGATAFVQSYAPTYDLPHVFVSATSDGFNRNIVMSRYPFTDLNGDGPSTLSGFNNAPDAYAPGGGSGIRGFQVAEIDLPDGTYAGDLVVGNQHLKSGGSSQDRDDRLRAAQNIAYFIDYYLGGAGTGTPDPNNKISGLNPSIILDPDTPVIWGGDVNEDEVTNGRKGPTAWMTQAVVAGGASTDGTDRDLSDSSTDDATEFFTGSRRTQNSGSKLDWLHHQDAIATKINAFVFDSFPVFTNGAVVPSEIAGYPSLLSMSSNASDHLPVVVDYRLPPAGVAVGACCLPDASCERITEADCLGQGGLYQGDGVFCFDVVCPDPTGACCFLNGSCSEETQVDCIAMGGTYQGDNVACVAAACPDPVGACCLQNALCVPDLTETDCNAQGGTYQGDFTDCANVECPQPVGACCFGGGCFIALEAQCTGIGGTFEGVGTDCAGACGIQPTGACSLCGPGDAEDCFITTELDCLGQGGVFVGGGTDCAGAPLFCPCDWNCDGALNDQDWFDWANDFFTGTGPVGTSDYNDDGGQNDQDWFDFVNCFFNPPVGC